MSKEDLNMVVNELAIKKILDELNDVKLIAATNM